MDISTIDTLQRSQNLSLRLNNNVWICDCEHEELFHFLKEYSNSNVSDVICLTKNMYFSRLKFTDVCPYSNIVKIVSALLCVITIICAVITILYYRYHIEIKIWTKAHKFGPGELPKDPLTHKTSCFKNSIEKLSHTNSIPCSKVEVK